jgi:hypothetical protein
MVVDVSNDLDYFTFKCHAVFLDYLTLLITQNAENHSASDSITSQNKTFLPLSFLRLVVTFSALLVSINTIIHMICGNKYTLQLTLIL